MFSILYAKSVSKDLKRISRRSLPKIKEGIAELEEFPNLSKIKRLKSHPMAEYRLRIGDYRVLFDVDWPNRKIFILKIGHRKDIY